MNAKKELFFKINGAQTCQILYAALETGLIERLKIPTPIAALKEIRLLGALHLYKIVAISEDVVSLTEEGKFLLEGHEESLAPLLRFKGAPFIFRAWSFLAEGIKRGCSPFELAHGVPLFSYLKTHPEDLKIFHEAMRYFTKETTGTLLKSVDFTPYQSAVDLGGSLGAFAEIVKREAPHLALTLFDLPEVIALLGELPNIHILSGSFFEKVPKADLYLLRNILHDWNDSSALDIIETVRKANPNASVLVVETCRQEDVRLSLGQISDLSLFVTTGEGRERTEKEWLTLFQQAHLTLEKSFSSSSAKRLFLLKL